MIVCVCVDDAMGMSFNRRRQSRDVEIYKRLVRRAAGAEIFVREYSLSLFSEVEDGKVRVTDDFSEAADADICFFELEHVTEHAEKAMGYIIYKWNRRYPSDKRFPFDLSKKGFILAEQTDFEGNSHDRITEEIWIKR